MYVNTEIGHAMSVERWSSNLVGFNEALGITDDTVSRSCGTGIQAIAACTPQCL